MVTAGDDENIKIYNTKKRKLLSNIFGIESMCERITSTPKYIISAHENGSVYVIGKKDFAVYHRIKMFKNKCIDSDIHSGNFLVGLSSYNRFSLWSLSTC